MNVAERPIVEARAMQIRKPAGRIQAVSWRAVDARVQHANIDASGNRRVELRQQALWRVLLGKTDAMNRRLKPATGEQHRFRAPDETLTDSGRVSSRVMRDSASWLPRMMKVLTPASWSRRS